MTTSRDLEALAQRHAALRTEVVEKARELQETRQLLDDARRRLRLPVLEALRITSPCRADWSRMAGDDRVRHCDDCKKYVYNLSAMTYAEAVELIESLERAPCVRYYERPDGTILFSDCAVTRSRRREGRLLAAGAVLAVGAGLVALAELPPAEATTMMMGVPLAVMGDLGYPPPGPDDEPPPEVSEAEQEAELEAERALPEAEQRARAVERADAVLGGPVSGRR
jgi:hypothetical protein